MYIIKLLLYRFLKKEYKKTKQNQQFVPHLQYTKQKKFTDIKTVLGHL